MSKLSRATKNMLNDKKTGRVTNFMNGNSYEWNPMDSLKMVTASSIFGEPQYYRDGEFSEKSIKDSKYVIDAVFTDYAIDALDKYEGLKTSDMMEKVIDEALAYDYQGVLDWAVTLRHDYLMRLNPQVIMVRAAISKFRKIWTEQNPGKFDEYNQKVMSRADDVVSQITYYLYIMDGKSKIPNILKKSWAKKLSGLSAYEIHKYKNAGIGIIDSVRISHACSKLIDELMQNGDVTVEESSQTWNVLRSEGKSWKEILDTIRLPHMALLRNLRGIFSEVDDLSICKEVCENLKAEVVRGKQFPFRYMSALNAIRGLDCFEQIKTMLVDTLEECMDIACQNLPRLEGNNAFLSDNSGSAWGTLNSEYGSVKVANIDNLSAVIGAANSDYGTVFKFGDELREFSISKKEGILKQAYKVDTEQSVGGATENGVWLFFDKALKKKIKYDNIFIYSDMQAGHGGLYGCNVHDYEDYRVKGRYIDVAKLVEVYRKKVNPKVNVFCIQTAGYNNVVVPENGYRTSLLYGWTGKELLYAKAINDFWDEKDNENN